MENAIPGLVGRVQFQNRAISTLAKSRKDRMSSGYGLADRFRIIRIDRRQLESASFAREV